MKKEIKSIAFIGLGALGVNFAYHFLAFGTEIDIRIVADKKRVDKYKMEGIFYNQQRCNFQYMSDEISCGPVDLAIFCTKFHGLEQAMKSMRNQIDEHTLIMSAINGISSEEVLSSMYKKENIIYTVAQGMDATKEGNQVYCSNMGELCFGDIMDGKQRDALETIDAFFNKYHFPHTIKKDILHHQWGKFMLNVGLNQVVAIHHGSYQTVQEPGSARDLMIQAMDEVLQISQYNGISLQQAERNDWIAMVDCLSPQGKPSMAQDVEAKRKTEVELFAGTMLELANQYGVDAPINKYLYQTLIDIEKTFL